MSLKTTLEALGNQVRRLSGRTNKMSLDAMTQALSGVNVGSNVSGADASITDVLNGKKFVGANGTLETGAMTNNGAVSKRLDTSTKTYNIPAGYHNGGGKVQIETQTKSVTPSASAQTVYPDAGKVLSAVTVAAMAGGKEVHTGTLNMNSATGINLDTKTAVSSADTFILVRATHDTYDALQDQVGYVTVSVCYIGGQCFSTVASYSSNDEGDYAPYLQDGNPTISFSGTTVNIQFESYYPFARGTAKWFLIKG